MGRQVVTLSASNVEEEGLVEVPEEENPDESDSILLMEDVQFPVSVSPRILEESGDVLESSPFLGHISWLSC
jgi:hypothetical protein